MDVPVSAHGIAALSVAQQELAKRVQGGLYPYGRFRSPDIDGYMTLVGLPPAADKGATGHPWCAAAVYWCFEQASAYVPGEGPAPNPCPRTAGALHMWDQSPLSSRRQLAAPGDVFVLDRGKGRGHVGFVLTVSPDGQTLTTVEPDTSSASSAAGDAWGTHLWQPREEARGRLVGYLELG